MDPLPANRPEPFPNVHRRQRPGPTPDSMASAAALKSSGQTQPPPSSNAAAPAVPPADPDTCRICRGDDTPEEPLFYPCKCSGSIKYVHQDCLMEWLSHSQKKHCELCKTPFRFTKLYSPDMPKRLPFLVFASHMAKYLFRNLLVWLRAALVISVWLGWLPYLMRSVWSFMFWISDEGFGAVPSSSADGRNTTSVYGNDAVSISIKGTTTCPSSPLVASTTTAATLGGVVDHIPVSNLLKAITKPINVSANQSWWASLLRMSLGSSAVTDTTIQGSYDAPDLTHVDKVTVTAVSTQPSSLLSDVSFLNNLTRHPAINRTIINVLEGQVITVLVIVCFILIILVRDYVVQQQPEINMRAAFAAAENEAQPQPPEAAHVNHHLDPITDSDEWDDEEDSVDGDIYGDDPEQAEHRAERERATHERWEGENAPPEYRPRPIAGFRRRATRQNVADAQADDGSSQASRAPEASGPSDTTRQADDGIGLDELLPNMEEGFDEGDYVKAITSALRDAPLQSTVSQYLRIYREAEGDRDKILRIIYDEGLQDRLGHWVRITQSMPPSKDTVPSVPPPRPIQQIKFRNLESGPAHSDSSSWTWSENDDKSDEADNSNIKGKAKAVGDTHPPATAGPAHHDGLHQIPDVEDASDAVSGTSSGSLLGRPRAISDGPQRHETINPLANNSWSFAALSSEPVSGETPAGDTAEQSGTLPSSSAPRLDRVSENTLSAKDEEESEPTQENTPASGLDSSAPEDAQESDAELPLGPQIPEPVPNAPAPDTAREAERNPQGLVARVTDYMWGDAVEAAALADFELDEPVDIFGDNHDPPFIENGNEVEPNDDDRELAPDVVEAAVAAGLDPEAIEDAEDFEGIMELIGMRGPLAGLFQNAIFCAFLVNITIFLGIFIPYNVGRITVWSVANPSRIIRMAFGFSKGIQDLCLLVLGYGSTFFLNIFEVGRKTFGLALGQEFLSTALERASHLASGAARRMSETLMSELPLISAGEIRNFSTISHQSLLVVKANINFLFAQMAALVVYVFGGDYGAKLASAKELAVAMGPVASDFIISAPGMLTDPSSWMVNLSPQNATTMALDASLTQWGAKDRFWAILAGYLAISVLAGMYLGRGSPLSNSQTAQEWEASIIDALNQASGVMKVILIISIEMLVFPLYCGLLLDVALLPLFEDTTLKSRMLFTYNYPLTSIFVHWFVGTGYMFHFALFVSMCRKIMRKGVLYFIRDPDDPEFHPVRDVLERNVTTQLRKIMFSAFVYGALVVICLGGVVWGLAFAIPNALPIHYSSNEPVLEFPIDLLFYNFLMPLAVKFFKPSDGLHAMYTWWFRRCARALRLTWFLFGERRVDEEGILQIPQDSPVNQLPWWRKAFLQVGTTNRVKPETWDDFFSGGKAKPVSKISTTQMNILHLSKQHLVTSGQLIPDGRFVRSPASDQVKIPKGQAVFLQVSEQDSRLDGRPDRSETDIYSGTHYQFVYVPPWFRTRVFLFILFIWIFAAITGVSFTIIPLAFGRTMFKTLIPAHIRTNDIYAFSIGIYILGSLSYFLFHLRPLMEKAMDWVAATANSFMDYNAIQRIKHLAKRAMVLAYAYTILLVVFPLLITLAMELYVLVPLHTYMYPPSSQTEKSRLPGVTDGHTIRVIQAWTLGILYLKLGSRALTLYNGRPGQAVRAVMRRGWLEPDVGILTRAFVIPGLTAGTIFITFPPLMAHLVLKYFRPDMDKVLAFRSAYPLMALGLAGLFLLRKVVGVLDGWQVRIRDEAYLMGERLHNFRGTSGRGTAGGATGWRAAARLR